MRGEQRQRTKMVDMAYHRASDPDRRYNPTAYQSSVRSAELTHNLALPPAQKHVHLVHISWWVTGGRLGRQMRYMTGQNKNPPVV